MTPDVSQVRVAFNKIEEDLDCLKSISKGEAFSKEALAHIQDIFEQLDVLKDKFKSDCLDSPWALDNLKGLVAYNLRKGKGIDQKSMNSLTHNIQQFFLRNFKIPDSLLVQAIKSGDRELAQSLIDKKHYIGGESFSNLYFILLHLYEKCDIEMLKLLIKNNIDINIMVKYAALSCSLMKMEEDQVKKIMQLLIDNKADFNQTDDFILNLIMTTFRRYSKDSERSNAITALKMLFINNRLNLEIFEKREGLIYLLEQEPEVLRLFIYLGMNPPEEFFSTNETKEIYEQAKRVRGDAIVEVLRKSDALPKEFQRDPFQLMLALEGRSMQDLNPELREKALQICLDHDAKAKG